MTSAERVQRLVHRRRMVGEVVIHVNAARLTDEILATAYPLERGHRGAGRVEIDAEALRRGGDGGDRIPNVVYARALHGVSTARNAASEEVERLHAPRVEGDGRAEPGDGVLARVVAFERIEGHTRTGVRRNDGGGAALAGVADDEAPLRCGVRECGEHAIVAFAVGIDVDVIVLHAGDDDHVFIGNAYVVQEFRLFVPVHGVVLVAFHHERRARMAQPGRGAVESRHDEATFRRTDGGARGKILRQSTNEISRLEAPARQKPRAHRARGRLAVRPGDHQCPTPFEKKFAERRRHRDRA